MLFKVGPLPLEVAGEDEQRAFLGVLAQAEAVIDERLVHRPQHDRLLVAGESVHVLVVELSRQNVFLEDAADFFGVGADLADHGGGVGIDSLGLEQDEIAEFQLPDDSRAGQQADHGAQFVGREGFARQSQLELLLAARPSAGASGPRP